MADYGAAIKCLKERMSELNKEKKKMTEKIDRDIQELDWAIKRLEDICPDCDGSGEERFLDGAGSRDTRKCKACGGSGAKRK